MLPRRRQPQAAQDLLRDQDQRALPITVLFTNVPETLEALNKAAELAYDLDASIRILVLEVVPYPLAIDRPSIDPEFRERQFRTFWRTEALETRIEVRLCRDAWQCLAAALAPNSLVVMGSHGSWWPFGRHRRLAGHLRRAGHEVLLSEKRIA